MFLQTGVWRKLLNEELRNCHSSGEERNDDMAGM
jgi:hypothetical protein